MRPTLCYIFRGPCGAGKTWLRDRIFEMDELEHCQVIDMCKCPNNVNFHERRIWLES